MGSLRVSLVTAVGLAVVAGTAAAASTPGSLLTASLAAGKAQGSVHYVARAKFGAQGVTIVGDAALDRGRQQITFTKGGTTGHGTVLVVNNTAYIKADAFTLVNYMQIDPTLANRWLSLAHTTAGFKDVAEAVRLGSAIDELKMTAPLKFVAGRSIGGSRTVGISGTAPEGSLSPTETLYVKSGKTPLPVEQVSTSASITFSRWKETVTVVAPASATPLK